MAVKEKKPIKVDYCKEAMEKNLSALTPRDIDLIVINLVKVVNGELNDLEIEWNKFDEKTKKPYKVIVPVKSFLRCDSIQKSLMSLGVSERKIQEFIK